MKIQVNSLLKQPSKPHFLSPQVYITEATRQFVRQLEHSVSCDNLLFYICTTPWLQLQHEAEWKNINFKQET